MNRHAINRVATKSPGEGGCEYILRPHPEELAKQASRRMDTTHGLAAILRDARKGALLRMRNACPGCCAAPSARSRASSTRYGLRRGALLIRGPLCTPDRLGSRLCGAS